MLSAKEYQVLPGRGAPRVAPAPAAALCDQPPTPSDPPRFHSVRHTAPVLTPGTRTVRLANVPAAEWAWLQLLLESRGWKSY